MRSEKVVHFEYFASIHSESACQLWDGELFIPIGDKNRTYSYTHEVHEITCPRCFDLEMKVNFIYPTTILKKRNFKI